MISRLKSVLQSPLGRALRRQISVYPPIYIPLRKFRLADTVVTPQTDLLIEGFPRCANTWTEALIREAGQDRLKLAHHSHAAAHVKRALSLDVPALILFRDPDAAVASLLVLSENTLDAKGAYLDYVRFYKTAWPLRGTKARFYSFEDATQRPTELVADLSAAFGLQLSDEDMASDAVKERLFTRMDNRAKQRKRHKGGMSQSRPDLEFAEKNRMKADAQAALDHPSVKDARAAAYAMFETLRSDLAQPDPAA